VSFKELLDEGAHHSTIIGCCFLRRRSKVAGWPKDAAQNVPKTSNAAIKPDLINRDDDDSDPGRSKETRETASEEASVVPTIVIIRIIGRNWPIQENFNIVIGVSFLRTGGCQCGDDERSDTDKSISDKTGELDSLQTEINTLDKAINDPEVGLLKQQADTEESLEENHDNQVFKTKQRKEENQAYQKDIANLVAAEELLQRAEKVLRDYYSKIDDKLGAASLVQREEPTTTEYIKQLDDTTSFAPPDTGMGEVGSYKGQSEKEGLLLICLSSFTKTRRLRRTRRIVTRWQRSTPMRTT